MEYKQPTWYAGEYTHTFPNRDVKLIFSYKWSIFFILCCVLAGIWPICHTLNFVFTSFLLNCCAIKFYCELSRMTQSPDSAHFFHLRASFFRSAPCGPRDQGVKFSARLVETVASQCLLVLILPPLTPPPPHQDPHPSLPGANSPSACTLLPVSSSIQTHTLCAELHYTHKTSLSAGDPLCSEGFKVEPPWAGLASSCPIKVCQQFNINLFVLAHVKLFLCDWVHCLARWSNAINLLPRAMKQCLVCFLWPK